MPRSFPLLMTSPGSSPGSTVRSDHAASDTRSVYYEQSGGNAMRGRGNSPWRVEHEFDYRDESMFKIRPLIAAFVLFFVGDSRAADESKKAPPKEPRPSRLPPGGERGQRRWSCRSEASTWKGPLPPGSSAATWRSDFWALEEIRESAPDELVERDPQPSRRSWPDIEPGCSSGSARTPRSDFSVSDRHSPRHVQCLDLPGRQRTGGAGAGGGEAPDGSGAGRHRRHHQDQRGDRPVRLSGEAGEQFHFQTFTSFPIYIPYSAEAELNLYAPTGSWFDPDRFLRLPWESRPLSWIPVLQSRRQGWGARFAVFPMPTHRFRRPPLPGLHGFLPG